MLSSPLSPMRKIPLLAGALGGALAGFIMSDKQLRMRLKKAKDAKAAAKILGTSLATKGKEVGGKVKEWITSDEVQEKVHETWGEGVEFLKDAAGKVGESAQDTASILWAKVQEELGRRKKGKKGTSRK